MVKIKEGFKGERLVSLPEELLASYRRGPLLYGILFTEDTIPPFSLRTINKHGVVTAMFFLEKMITCTIL